MNSLQLRTLIKAVLVKMGHFSKEAEDLLMLTAAQESHCGKYIRQIGGGPARGIFQMEPFTLDDIFTNYLAFRPDLAKTAEQFQSQAPDLDLEGNLLFQIAVARILYIRIPAAIPKRGDFPGNNSGFENYIMALARYWKSHWNTVAGAGTVKEAVENYNKYAKERM
jgi:hypothetical protein